jgi:hypothetical protein
MRRIRQAYVAPKINFFKKEFMDFNGLVEYYNEYEPAIFFGINSSVNAINNHKGIKILLPSEPLDISDRINYENAFLICSENYNIPSHVNRRNITPRIKNYDIFKPNVMGDKIYFYSGFKNGWNHKNEEIISIIKNKTNFEIITTDHNNLQDYYDIKYLKENFYDKSFININMTDGNSLTTAIELGLMGRKTVFRNKYTNNIQRLEFPNFISYENIEDILDIISNESKKIGTIQEPIDAHNVGDEWLDLDFWL